jgi:hypothetical protein
VTIAELRGAVRVVRSVRAAPSPRIES